MNIKLPSFSSSENVFSKLLVWPFITLSSIIIIIYEKIEYQRRPELEYSGHSLVDTCEEMVGLICQRIPLVLTPFLWVGPAAGGPGL